MVYFDVCRMVPYLLLASPVFSGITAGNATLSTPPVEGTVTSIKLTKTESYLVGSVTIGKNTEKGMRKYDEYKVVPDTGSANLWVFSGYAKEELEDAKSYHDKFQHNYYNILDSETYRNYDREHEYLVLNYDVGTRFEGEMVSETVTIGGIEIEKTGVGIVEKMNDVFKQLHWTSYDGMLGLGFTEMAKNKATPPFIQMANEKKLSQNVFSMYVHPSGETGELVLGGINPSFYNEGDSITYVNLASEKGRKQRWEVSVQEAWLGDHSLLHTDEVELDVNGGVLKVNAHIDTFNPSICAPAYVIDRIMEVAQKHGAYKEEGVGRDGVPVDGVLIDCKALKHLPDLTLKFGSGEMSFSAREYFIKSKTAQKKGTCRLGIRPSTEERDGWKLGLLALRKYYCIFDYDEREFGFVRAVSSKGGQTKNTGGGQARRRRSSGNGRPRRGELVVV